MNYLDILTRASIDVAAAAENIKLPNAGTQVRGCSAFPEFRAYHSFSTARPQPEDTLPWQSSPSQPCYPH